MSERIIQNPLKARNAPVQENTSMVRTPEEDKEMQELIRQHIGAPPSVPVRVKTTQAPPLTRKDLDNISDDLGESEEKEPDNAPAPRQQVKPGALLPPDKKEIDKLITNVAGPDAAVPPPPITPEQRRRMPKEETSDVYSGKPRFVLNRVNPDIKYIRVDLLSGFFCYPFKECMVRRINIQDHLKIMSAQKTRNLSLLIDAIGSTLADDIDIRDFKIADFHFLLYWHRLNSYGKVPYELRWTSKYGNQNNYKLKESSIKYDTPKITEERYAEWEARGFTLPSVRDLELFNRESFSEEEMDILSRAQYFSGYHSGFDASTGKPPDIYDKVKHMNELNSESLEALSEVNQFLEEAYFDVKEYVEITDAKFDAAKWLETLKERYEIDKRYVDGMNKTSNDYLIELETLKLLEDEIFKLEDSLKKGVEVKPDVEQIPLNVSFLDMFPKI